MLARSNLMQSLAAVARETELVSILRRIVSWVLNAGSRYEEVNLPPIANHVLQRVDSTMAAEAIEIVSAIGIRPLRLYLLLPKPRCSELIESELAQVRAPESEVGVAHRAFVVGMLVEHLDPERRAQEVAEALEEARALDSRIMRQHALRDLLPLVSADDQKLILDELIAAAIEHPHDFVQLAKHAPEAWHREICKALEGQATWCIVATGPELAAERRAPLIEQALSEIEERTNATSLLDDLIPLLNAEQLDRALRIIRRRLDGWQKAEALIEVAREAGGAAGGGAPRSAGGDLSPVRSRSPRARLPENRTTVDPSRAHHSALVRAAHRRALWDGSDRADAAAPFLGRTPERRRTLRSSRTRESARRMAACAEDDPTCARDCSSRSAPGCRAKSDDRTGMCALSGVSHIAGDLEAERAGERISNRRMSSLRANRRHHAPSSRRALARAGLRR